MKDIAKKFDYPQKDFYKLTQMRTTAELLEHPELGRKTVLVAGTNGKGSVTSFLSHMLLRAGYSVGSYTSPHVVYETERIQINGKPISPEELETYKTKYADYLSPLTYFERMTMLAFLVFRDRNVDWQVIEVGMGGRLDATNICEPDLSIVCSIGLDHQAVLGETYAEIAREKAGIFRRKKTAIWHVENHEARREIEKIAEDLRVDPSFSKTSLFLFEDELKEIETRWGRVQRQNLELALRAFLWIQRSQDVYFSLSAIVSQALPLGRQQIYRLQPPLVIDGAHNEAATQSLSNFLNRQFKGARFEAIFGLMEDKNPKPILELMKPFLASVSLPVFFLPRQRPAMELAEDVRRAGISTIRIDPTVEKSLSRFDGTSAPILIFGSFYLAGEALKVLEARRRVQG